MPLVRSSSTAEIMMGQFFFGLLAGIIVGLVMEWVIDWTGLLPKKPGTKTATPKAASRTTNNSVPRQKKVEPGASGTSSSISNPDSSGE